LQVTAVGATRGFNPEVAAFDTFASGSVFTSGAGFSNYFPRPAYQEKTISTYLKSIGNLNQGFFNPNGRAYPVCSSTLSDFTRLTSKTGHCSSRPTFCNNLGWVNCHLRRNQRQCAYSCRCLCPCQRRTDLIWKTSSGLFEPMVVFWRRSCIHRYSIWKLCRLWYKRLPSTEGMGCSYWIWNSRLLKDPPSCWSQILTCMYGGGFFLKKKN
jgi:hypothetical protein